MSKETVRKAIVDWDGWNKLVTVVPTIADPTKFGLVICNADWSPISTWWGWTGDVVWPASSIDNRVVFFDGITGKLIKDNNISLSWTNTGDQTSIVWITWTKAQYDTSCTDGNFLYAWDVTQYTDEMAQDAVGGMVDSSLTYVDATPLLQRAALTGAITASAWSNTTALWSFTTAQLNTALSDNDILPLAGATYPTTTGNWLALTTSTLTTGNLVNLASTGTVAWSNTQTVLNVATSGTNWTSAQTTYGTKISNTHAWTTSTNVALQLSATGGTTANYALLVPASSWFVWLGTTTPTALLTIVSTNSTGTGTSAWTSITANSLTSGAGLSVTSSSATTGFVGDFRLTGTAALTGGRAIHVEASWANTNSGQTVYGGVFTNTRTGSTSTNVAFYANASGWTNNYAGIFDGGSVGVSTTTPLTRLDLGANLTTSSQVKVGTFELQAFSTNNAFFGDNAFYNGANFQARAAWGVQIMTWYSWGFEIRTNGTTYTAWQNVDAGMVRAFRVNPDWSMWFTGNMSGTWAFPLNTLTWANIVFSAAGAIWTGTTSPSARIHAIATTEQLRLGYDTSNYFSTTVSSAWVVTFNAVWASSSFVFSDPITSPTLTTPILWTPTSWNLDNCTADWTDKVWFRNIPSNSQSAAYTAVLADGWKSIDHPSTDANARTYTIPANASVAYPVGTTLSFSNMTSQVVTIAITTDTMYLAWTGTTGSRSLAQYGVATARKLTSTTWIISWVGLT